MCGFFREEWKRDWLTMIRKLFHVHRPASTINTFRHLLLHCLCPVFLFCFWVPLHPLSFWSLPPVFCSVLLFSPTPFFSAFVLLLTSFSLFLCNTDYVFLCLLEQTPRMSAWRMGSLGRKNNRLCHFFSAALPYVKLDAEVKLTALIWIKLCCV